MKVLAIATMLVMGLAATNAKALQKSDWGGDMVLEKTGVVYGTIILAYYENHMHNHDVDRQLVQCIAFDLAE